MTHHTNTAAAVLPRGALAGERPLLSPGTHSLPTRATENPARATSPAASVAGAFIPANAKPVTYQGTTYPSRAALARALGMTPQNVRRAASSGSIDTLGKGSNWGGFRSAKPITHNGTTYPSQVAMARALGLPASTINGAIKRNGLKTLGAGKEAGRAYAIAARRQPVAAHGWEWSSQTEAAKALGIGDSAVCDMLRRGTFAKNVFKRLGAKP